MDDNGLVTQGDKEAMWAAPPGLDLDTKAIWALLDKLSATTLGPTGLPSTGLVDPDPTRGYGLGDGLHRQMAGDMLHRAALYWNATGILADLYAAAGPASAPQAGRLQAQAGRVRAQITKELWNETLGVFVAATALESDRISVWGNALAGASGLATAAQAAAIYAMFRDREADIFFEGQVRQVSAPYFWDSTHSRPHVLTFIGQYNRSFGCRLLHDAVASFRSHGINEWIGPYWPAGVQGAHGYVATAAGAYYGSKVLRCGEVGAAAKSDDAPTEPVRPVASKMLVESDGFPPGPGGHNASFFAARGFSHRCMTPPPSYHAFGLIGTTYRQLEWKTPIVF